MRIRRKGHKLPDPVADALYDNISKDEKISELVILYDEAALLLFNKPKIKHPKLKNLNE